MATLQVKNLPDELHTALKQRAEAEGVSMSDLVTRMLRRDLALPSMDVWAQRHAPDGFRGQAVDAVAVLDEIRGPWPEE